MRGFRCYTSIEHSAEREMSALCLIPHVYKRDWQVKLCDPSLTRAIPEHFSDELLTIKYTTQKSTLLYFDDTARDKESNPKKTPPKGAYK